MGTKRELKKNPEYSEIENQPAYYTFGDSVEERTRAVNESAKSLQEYTGTKVMAGDARFQDLSNLLPGISSRPGFNAASKNLFRPEEGANSHAHREVIYRCNEIYNNVGLIKNVIDLMADFACQGVRVSNPDKKAEVFGRNWFKIVKGEERSERFLNYLFRLGNVVVRKQNAKIPIKVQRKLSKTTADSIDGGEFRGNENDFNLPEYTPQNENVNITKTEKKVIPWIYTFYDPANLILVGGPLSSFVGEKVFAMVVPDKVRRLINTPKTDADKRLVEKLPKDILQAAQSKRPYLLPKDKVRAFYYKKDDWMPWANPMIFSILTDCVMLNKLKLCDNSALDGAISNIRIFKLGNIEHKILPTPFAAAKLSSILQSNVGGGTMDLIWGADLTLEESNSQVYKFLGHEKYIPTLNAIFQGLGVPVTLIGAYEGGGTTNNYIALKTLIERLEYGRRQLNSFWEEELEIVRKAMGFKNKFIIEYDMLNLADDDSIKNLYMSLVDKNILSEEAILRIFRQNPEMERIRNMREFKEMQSGKRVEKAGPYKEPVATESLKKIALQQGSVTPRQVGLDVDDPENGDENMLTVQHKHAMEKLKLANKNRGKFEQEKNIKGKPGQGRPQGKKDTSKRAEKKFTPKSKAAIEVWANTAQESIGEMLKPAILAQYNKKNLRMLTNEEASAAELLKFGVLSNIEPLSQINEEKVIAALNSPILSSTKQIRQEYLNEYFNMIQKNPTFDEIKQIQSVVYANLITNEGNENE